MDSAAASASFIDRRLLESIERAFASHAGPDARIELAQMRSLLGVRTEAIAKRMFELFDTDHDGTITRDELVAAVRKLIAATTRDKLRFAFELHDENGDGTIGETELHLNWERELAAIQQAHAPAPVHIYLCGPAGLGKTIARLAARRGMPFREEKF